MDEVSNDVGREGGGGGALYGYNFAGHFTASHHTLVPFCLSLSIEEQRRDKRERGL